MLFSLDDRQRRELWGLGLLALALLLALSLFPLDWFQAAARLPARNVVGPAGGWLRAALVGGLGLGALAIPVLCGIWGLVAFDKLPTQPALRWSILLAGLAVIAPAAVAVLGGADPSSPVTGAMGAGLGGGMAGMMGTVGSVIVLATLFAALCVATVGWNPLRSAVAGGRFAWGHTRRAAAALPVPRLPLRRGAVGEDEDEEYGDEEDEGDEEDFGLGGDGDDWMDVPLDDEPVGAAVRAPALPAMDPDATLPSPGPAKLKRGKPVLAEQGDLLAEAGDPTSTDLPATTLLTAAPPRDEAKNRAELDKLGTVLVEKLATFKIEGQVVGMTTGPVVTQFEVEPAPGVKVARIANLEADLALALRAPSVRIVAPIPGKGAVGVEVPNPAPEMVHFREVIESQQFKSSKAALPLALGKDIGGRPLVADLARMPHLLI
ncbi:MAG TPA: DNA translocase FtsK 4TM domain-containing protein, partial [Longimicrobium sp.]